MTTRFLTWLGVLGAAALVGGCDLTSADQCDPVCEDGLVCNTGTTTCETPHLDALQDRPAGRSARLAVVGSRAYLAAIDPETGHLLVGSARGGEPDMYVLTKLTRPLGRQLALAASSDTLAVAWLQQDGSYRVATHQIGDDVDRWQLHPSVEANGTYRGSEHFDVAVEAAGGLRLVFHDAATQALRSLRRGEGTAWSLQDIDDPQDQPNTAVCSEQQRRLADKGLGYDPDIALRAGAAFVAYHDADCGDLRLASRLDDQWTVTVVDTGDFERDDMSITRGITGRHPSIAVDGDGSLAIAYQDTSRGQLVVAYERQGGFEAEVADAGVEVDQHSRTRKHLVGGFASLVFDHQDIPWVAYLDATATRLRIAHRTRPLERAGNWAHRTVDAPEPTGFSAALGFSTALGRVVAAEHLRPRSDGLESLLEVVYEEEL